MGSNKLLNISQTGVPFIYASNLPQRQNQYKGSEENSLAVKSIRF